MFTLKSWRLRWGHPVAWLAALLLAAGAAQGASVPTGFNDRQVASGLTSPTSMAVMPDGRVLVVQQDGIVRIIKADAMLTTPFYAAPNVDATNERGCLGVVPDPAFATNHYVYLYCTTKVGSVSRNRVLRVTEANDVAVAGSERVIFELPDVPSATKWHMGGAMRFGTDGKLYVAVGNHEDNPQPVATANSQNLASAFGKILRINADGTVPSDNPFFTNATAYKAVWALGFRNPFVLDIQPGTGLTYIGDVGQGSWEEVNRGQAGGNYGWPAVEGSSTNTSYLNPVYAYPHSVGCSITGTAFYNPATASFGTGYVGQFFFSDFCNGTVRYFNPATPTVINNFASGIGNPTNIGVAPSGAIYYLARNQATGTPAPGAGTVGKISYTGSQAPRITAQPQSQTVYIGTPATFSAAADGATSVQWQRNGANISGATSGSYTLSNPQVADSGARFRATFTNSFGSVTTDEGTLTVTTNRSPTARIDTPSATYGFATGDVVSYSGVGTDPEDGNLAGANLTWKVDFQHDSHAHTFVTPVTGSSGSFTVPDFEASEANMWLRITLTVRDSSGATNTVTRDIYPRTQLSSFPLIGTPANGWGPYEVDRSNGEQGAADGRPLSIGGVPYPRGLGTHAQSDLRFNLNRACSGSFIADLGVDDEVGDNGSVVFQVYTDGTLAYDSGTLTGASLRKTALVNVANVAELRLVVTDAGNGNGYDHADWGGARVTGCGAPPAVTISNLAVSDGANSADWSVQSNLQAGNTAYGDRTYTWSAVPAAVAGGRWIRTANDSKSYTGTPLVSFAISAAADVYVALDNRSALPSWVDSSWTDSGVDLTQAESGTVSRGFSLWRKRFNAGTVTLGPWNNAGTSMYTVIVK
ncbi:MAG TPA: PQQ-dependent sugar dehydrogenase [Rhizobacter sp.]|nr:PQQ-dependent sugar dehydrogenase [Rhizobacter sp.]